nr:fumarylacetoacetate hydrolase family protein [uncultured Nocardioides sp.]
MKLATIRTDDGATRAVRLSDGGDELIDVGATDVGQLLSGADWRRVAESASGASYPVADADFAPVVPGPSKVICVGHNYRNHIAEMGRELPDHPTLFAKFADTLTGAFDDLEKPAETDALDWEAELVVVIGKHTRRASSETAANAIAGFTVMNDVSVRDWQFRTVEWTQGKIWDSSTPVGPYMTTPDELPGGRTPSLRVTTTVDGQVMQDDNTGTLLFDPVELVRYVSTIVRLRPGDLIATGTPAGVGHARSPRTYLNGGELVVTEIEGLGACANKVVRTS